jgi:hypothetical protein
MTKISARNFFIYRGTLLLDFGIFHGFGIPKIRRFPLVTVELVDMLEWIKDDRFQGTAHSLHHIKQVFDGTVIDKLFRLIDLTTSHVTLQNILNILRSLGGVDAISLLEVHQRISLIKNMCYDDARYNSEDNIFSLLLNLSYFEKQLRPIFH